METTKHKMPPNTEEFFKKLSKYLDTKIYFFGSIQRNDYFPESSDIDADIFTDNESSTISKMQNFLHLPKYDFKKFVYKLHKTNKLVYGYKVKYEDNMNNIKTEISIYNDKDKEDVLLEHNSKVNLPFFISILLIILKTFYYNFGIVPKTVYKYLKSIIMNYLVEGEDVEFITIDVPKHKIDK